MIVWLFLPGSQRRAFPVENELCVSCRRLEIWPRAQRSAFEHEMWIVDWTEDERPGARCLQLSPDAGRCAARGSSALCSHGCLNMLEPAGTATATGTTPLRSGRVLCMRCGVTWISPEPPFTCPQSAQRWPAGLVWTY